MSLFIAGSNLHFYNSAETEKAMTKWKSLYNVEVKTCLGSKFPLLQYQVH